MAISYYMSPITMLIQYFSNVGLVLNGGFVNTYVAGTVATPVTTYTDSSGTTVNANPIALSSAGRLVAAGTGAPVTCWVPASTPHKMVVTDSGGNLIISIDNLQGMNDPTALLTLLAASSAGSGSDLVANAVKSYLNFAAIRAAPAPTPVSGQTVIAMISGRTGIADGLGGLFIWNAAATTADDNYATLRPTAVLSANPGRWTRAPLPYLPNFNSGNPVNQGGTTQGLFSASLTGFAGAVTVNGYFYIIGGPASTTPDGATISGQFAIVNLNATAGTGTSNTTTMTLQLPPALSGTAEIIQIPIFVEDNNAFISGFASIQAGLMNFGKVPGIVGGFTASGIKGLPNPQLFLLPVSP